MINISKPNILLIFMLALSFSFLSSCSNSDDTSETINTTELTQTDKEALMFMLEEEKLARDTYNYLDNLWGTVQFTNIKLSEQSHMDAVAALLTIHTIPFEVLPEGEFINKNLQDLYDHFIIDGGLNEVDALKVGATIEDLDIVDLETNIKATTNVEVLSVFESLQCGSRNHLRSFVSAIENSRSIYTPQFLTQEAFNLIINSTNEQCN